MVTVELWAIEVRLHLSETVAATIEKSSANKMIHQSFFPLDQSTFGVQFAEIFALSMYESAKNLKPD